MEINARLMDLLELSRTMKAHAQSGNWACVATYDRKRREQLAALCAGQYNEELARYPALIHQLVDLDRQVLALSRNALKESAAQLKKLQHTQHYQDTSGQL